MWFGTVIGALLGYSIAGWLGALLGALVGLFFDRSLAQNLRGSSSEQRAKIESVFFTTLFSLMGRLAKVDGRVSEAEVSQTEQLMAQMGLNPQHRQEAIRLFKEGAAQGFSVDATLQEFLLVCGRFANLRQMLLVYLISVALADGGLHAAEEQLLRQVAQILGFSALAFEQLLTMIRAQDRFARGHFAGDDDSRRYGAPERAGDLSLAYQALGVSEDASDTVVKRAYRRLISEYHPDKLIGQGMPEDVVKVATERSQEVQAAYDLIRKSRKRSAA